jgi:hypothetical protein
MLPHMRSGHLIAGRFEVERFAGAGAMGLVYLARDAETGGRVALKILAHGGTERFLREARVLAEMKHPNIVRYVAHGITETDEPYLAMEWLEGEDLARRLQRGALGMVESVTMVGAVCRALAEAHSRGVVHRDIKPSNLFLVGGDAGTVKVLDFGAARFDRTASAATASGIVLGTPGYMAPEQVRDERPVDRRADIFALGCVLFEALTGRAAFVAQHVLALLGKILRDEPPLLRDLVPLAPPELEALVTAMLKKDPTTRLADAALIADTLEQLKPGIEEREGTRAAVAAEVPPRGKLVFRWWNDSAGDHFYTTDASGELAPGCGYAYEGAPFHTFPEGTASTTPFYRWYSQSGEEHFYTTDPSGELDPKLGYKLEGILGFIATTQLPGTVALHRWWQPSRSDHFYTTHATGELAPKVGYEYEGVAGYVLPAARTTSRATIVATAEERIP